MEAKDRVRERMKGITEEIRNNKSVNMNSLMAPEPCGYDEDRMAAEIRFKEKTGNEMSAERYTAEPYRPCLIRPWV